MPSAWALNDATSFSPEQVQVQAANIGVPVGTVLVWTKEQIPDGWLECDGQKVNDVLYPELAALMPTTPNYKGRFLQGTDTNTKVGDKIEAGIPNITGTLPNIWSYMNGGYGAFGAYNIVASNIAGSSDAAVEGIETIFIDASRCSPVYKNGLNTVQPPAVVVKYIIKAE